MSDRTDQTTEDASEGGPLQRQLEREQEKRRSNRYDKIVSVRYREDQFELLEKQAEESDIPVSTCVRLLSLRPAPESRSARARLEALLEEEALGPAEEKVREAIAALPNAS